MTGVSVRTAVRVVRTAVRVVRTAVRVVRTAVPMGDRAFCRNASPIRVTLPVHRPSVRRENPPKMVKPKKPAARKATVKFTSRKAAVEAPAVAAPAPVAEKRPDAPAAPVARRPDAPPALVAKHARRLASQVRVDAAALAHAKVAAPDAHRLETLADALDAAQEAWLVIQDARAVGVVAATRDPVRAGRDHVFAALRTFADANPTTQSALDDIGDVQGDDDLISDTTRLLALAKKHHHDLDGTDLTDARLATIRSALGLFAAARGGAQAAAGTTTQAEDEVTRSARRARNRAFWALADLDRQVARRGQYAFRDDEAKRARYAMYRRSATTAAVEGASPEPAPVK